MLDSLMLFGKNPDIAAELRVRPVAVLQGPLGKADGAQDLFRDPTVPRGTVQYMEDKIHSI